MEIFNTVPSIQEHLEHECCEIVRGVYEAIHRSNLDRFTFSFLDSLYADLSVVLYRLDHLPEEPFTKLILVIQRLSVARNELRLARFLFHVEEIHPVYCLLMRNRALLRGKRLLQNVLQVWPLNS